MKKLLVILCIALSFIRTEAQGVGIGTIAPNMSAILDLTSTTKGVLIPRMTGAQRVAIPSPSIGMMVYQTNLEILNGSPGLYVHSGTAWKRMARAEELTAGTSSWTVTGIHQYSNVDGNVGIGLNSGMSEKLTIKGDMLIQNESATDHSVLKFQSQSGPDAGGGKIEFQEPDATTGASIDYSPTYNVLSIYNSIDNNGVLRFYDNGNVGINTNLLSDAVSKLQIQGGNLADYTNHGYLLLGSQFGRNLVFSDEEILARNNGLQSPLYLQQEGGMVKIGNLGGTIDTRLYITNGGESSLTTHGHMVLGPVTGANLVLDPNEIQARSNGTAATLRLQQDGGPLIMQGGALSISAAGNVGVGTLSPASLLHVNGATIVDGTATFNGNITMNTLNPTLQLQNSGVDKGFVQLSGDNIRIGTNSSNAAGLFVVRTGGGDHVFVNGNGNMGLGVSNPVSKLHVDGHVRILDDDEALRIDGVNPNIGFYQSGVFKSAITLTGNNLYVSANAGKMRLNANQIAIGDIQSTADDYKLTVTGKIICEELKVELKANWPDYVFARDYQLTPLNELRAFIETHAHLPNIPMASEVQKEGFEVGEMQRKLLEKVEELTLYILQQQEEIDMLKQKIELSK